MRTPDITVIVPIYNVKGQVHRCLESVRTQTHAAIDVLCVDDGSTDGSGEIAEAFASRDSRFTVIHQANGGLSCARNTGLAKADAPFVLFCDADDELAPDMAERLLLRAHETEADVVRCGVEVVRPGADVCRSVGDEVFRLPFSAERVLTGMEAFGSVDVVAWNKLYRRDLLERQGIRFAEGAVHEDFGFFLKCCLVARRIAFVEDPLYRYILRDTGIMGAKARSARGALDYLRVLEDAFAFMTDNGLAKSRLPMFLRAYVRGFHAAAEDCPPDGLGELFARARRFLTTVPGERGGVDRHLRGLLSDILKGRRATRRYGIAGLTLVKVTNRLDKAALRVCGLPVWQRRFA